MRRGSRPVDLEIAYLATRQHGVVARRQLLGFGLSARAVDRRVEAGRLHRLHRGVYAVGHRRLTRHGVWLAAVLACGDGAVLSHASAAALWGIAEIEQGQIHVAAVRGRGGPRRGIVVHRPRRLTDDDRAERWGVPVTAPAPTLVDLAGMIGEAGLRRAIDAADRLDLLDLPRLTALADRANGRRGIRRLRAALALHRPLPQTRSELERQFIRLCEGAGIPRPAVNVPIRGLEVDCAWPAKQLVVELDGYAYHRGRASFESDRSRDARLTAAGYRVMRFTSRRLIAEPNAVVAELRAALAAKGASPSRS
jgi:predicted transcriptional regulator of viral defense system